MSIVRVKDDRVIEKPIKQGKEIIREQRVCVLMGGGYESTYNVGLGNGPAYSVGDYLVHPDSYGHGTYGDMQLNRVKLIRLDVALKECGVVLPAAPAAAKAA